MTKDSNQTKRCKYCAEIININAKYCPYCRRKQGVPVWKVILGIVGVFYLISILISVVYWIWSVTSSPVDPADISPFSNTEITMTEELTEEPLVGNIGESLQVGNFEYIVNSIEQKEIIGDEWNSITPQNHYLMINIAVTNKGNELAYVSDNNFKLRIDEKEYEPSIEGSAYDKNALTITNFNPDTTITGNIYFDIAQETINDPNLQLQVGDDFIGEETGLINLN